MTYIVAGPNAKDVYCFACQQLRLWLREEAPVRCGNCQSTEIKAGPVNDPEISKLRWPDGEPVP